MKAYKGFNKDLTCRGFQYEVGKEYETDKAELCESGFHACENPLDCFNYYEPGSSVYHEVELDDVSDERRDDTKIVGKKIKVGGELSVAKICKLHFEYVKEHTIKSEQAQDMSSLSAQDMSSLSARNMSSLSAQDMSSLSAQDRSSLSAQNRSSLSAQDMSSLSAQDWSKLSGGKDCVIAAFNSKAKAGIGSLIALANRKRINGEYKITDAKAAIVDGEKLKSDTWYTLKNGEFVEAEDE